MQPKIHNSPAHVYSPCPRRVHARRSPSDARRAHEHDDLDTTEDTVARERKIGMRTAARIGLMLLLAVFIITAISVGWRATFVGTAFVFCAVVIFGGPVWLASIEDEEDDEHECRTGEHRANP